MSQAPATAHAEEHHTSTGLSHNKILMWAFLASDCMFFGSLIMTYMIYRNRSVTGPYPRDVLNIPYTSVSAAVLLLSSLMMVLALSAIQRGKMREYQVWQIATAALGLLFLGGQFYEFSSFYQLHGLSLSSNLFGSTFFVLTGFHGTHVGIGVIWLLSLVIMSFRGKLTPEMAEKVEIAGLYWHFVDIVWIIIFTVVYLIPY
ncbi:MAG TPA: heme-copper oxidase subunit III [Thermomicrobiaceae bacterium]|nr:heme-copper oxidase subunit III [Thermomicrobiaceae bacterium]